MSPSSNEGSIMYNPTIRSLAIGAVVLFGAASAAMAEGQAIGHTQASSPLVGTWQVVITPYICLTGVPLPVAAFKSRLTFNAGGTMVETAFNPTFQPGQTSSGLGHWESAGQGSYHNVFEAFVYFNSVVTPPAMPRYVRGVRRVEQGIVMVDDNHWTSSAVVTFTDDAGTIVPPSGCMTATGERLQ
jgi:hypothetical protein